jgi:predicted transcriptional regulator
MASPKKLEEDEARVVVLRILKEEGPMTTVQIEERVQKRGEECPDSVVLFLSKLRLKGVIKGKVSQEHRGWLWWVEEE